MRSLLRQLLIACSLVAFTGQVSLAALVESGFWSERKRVGAPGTQYAMARPLASRLSALPAPRPLARTAGVPLRHAGRSLTSRSLRNVIASVPANIATVRSVEDSGSGVPAVMIVQDVHQNAEAQRNIAGVLAAALRSGSEATVAVEGVFGPMSARFFENFPSRAITGQVANEFLEAGMLAAPSFVAITQPDLAAAYVGVDDPAHHRANVAAFLEARGAAEALEPAFAEAERVLAELKARHFSPALRRHDAARASNAAGSLPLGDYLVSLAAHKDVFPGFAVQQFLEAHVLERSLDFQRVEAERLKLLARLAGALGGDDVNRLVSGSLAYRTGRITSGAFYAELRDICRARGVPLRDYPAFDDFVRYALLADGLSPEKLFDEVAALETAVEASLASGAADRELLAASRRLELMRKMARFELTPQEWSRLSGMLDAPASVAGFQPVVDAGDAIAERLRACAAFYREADIRSRRMVENILASRAAGPTILVTGGFHSPKIAALLAGRGVPHVVVAPKISRVEGLNGSAYLSIFAREKTPLDRLFAGEKLFVASPIVNLPRVEKPLAVMTAARHAEEGVALDRDAVAARRENIQGMDVSVVELRGGPRSRIVVSRAPLARHDEAGLALNGRTAYLPRRADRLADTVRAVSALHAGPLAELVMMTVRAALDHTQNIGKVASRILDAVRDDPLETLTPDVISRIDRLVITAQEASAELLNEFDNGALYRILQDLLVNNVLQEAQDTAGLEHITATIEGAFQEALGSDRFKDLAGRGMSTVRVHVHDGPELVRSPELFIAAPFLPSTIGASAVSIHQFVLRGLLRDVRNPAVRSALINALVIRELRLQQLMQIDGKGFDEASSEILEEPGQAELLGWISGYISRLQARKPTFNDLGVVVHDLRNPMSIIRTAIYILEISIDRANVGHAPPPALSAFMSKANSLPELINGIVKVQPVLKSDLPVTDARYITAVHDLDEAMEALRSALEHEDLAVSVNDFDWYADLIAGKTGDASEIRDPLEMILRQVEFLRSNFRGTYKFMVSGHFRGSPKSLPLAGSLEGIKRRTGGIAIEESIAPDARILLDPDYLEMIWDNLLQNAEKAGATRVSVDVTASGAPGDGWVEIRISDDAGDMPENLRGTAAIQRGQSGSGSTGLGLNTVWRIVQDAPAARPEVTIEPAEYGQHPDRKAFIQKQTAGTPFIVRLPWAAPDAPAGLATIPLAVAFTRAVVNPLRAALTRVGLDLAPIADREVPFRVAPGFETALFAGAFLSLVAGAFTALFGFDVILGTLAAADPVLRVQGALNATFQIGVASALSYIVTNFLFAFSHRERVTIGDDGELSRAPYEDAEDRMAEWNFLMELSSRFHMRMTSTLILMMVVSLSTASFATSGAGVGAAAALVFGSGWALALTGLYLEARTAARSHRAHNERRAAAGQSLATASGAGARDGLDDVTDAVVDLALARAGGTASTRDFLTRIAPAETALRGSVSDIGGRQTGLVPAINAAAGSAEADARLAESLRRSIERRKKDGTLTTEQLLPVLTQLYVLGLPEASLHAVIGEAIASSDAGRKHVDIVVQSSADFLSLQAAIKIVGASLPITVWAAPAVIDEANTRAAIAARTVLARTGARVSLAVVPQPEGLVKGESILLNVIKASPLFGRDLNQTVLMLPAGLSIDASTVDPDDYRGMTIVFLNQLLGSLMKGVQLETIMKAARAAELSA